MEWYHAYGAAAGTASLALLAVPVLGSRRQAGRESRFHRGSIKGAICDAEAVVRSVSSLSRDYDYGDEGDVSERIAAYAGKNMPKIDRCMGEIRAHRMYLKSGGPLANKVDRAVETLEWFADSYRTDGRGPSMKQRVLWNEDRGKLGGGIDCLLGAAGAM